jgi:hypothetical protein
MTFVSKTFYAFSIIAFLVSFIATDARACDCDHEHESHYSEYEISSNSDDNSGSEDICIDCEACCVGHHHISQYNHNGGLFFKANKLEKLFLSESNFKSNHIEVLKSPPKA